MTTVKKEIYKSALTKDSAEVIFLAENWYKNFDYGTEIVLMVKGLVKIRTKSISKAAIERIAGERFWRMTSIVTGQFEIQIYTDQED